MSTTELKPSEKRAVDKALKSFKEGKKYSHNMVMADMQKKYPLLIKIR